MIISSANDRWDLQVLVTRTTWDPTGALKQAPGPHAIIHYGYYIFYGHPNLYYLVDRDTQSRKRQFSR